MPSFIAPTTVFSAGDDSTALALNQISHLEDKVLFGFNHGVVGESYTISLALGSVPSVVNVFLLDVFTNSIVDLNQMDCVFRYNETAPRERFRLFVSKNNLGIEES